MNTPQTSPRDLFARLRSHRLTATFALLATLSVGILAGSLLTRSVSGKEQTVDSSDARPLTIPNPVNLSNDFSKIAKAISPAVVNINTVTIPKQSANKRGNSRRNGPLQLNPPDNGSGGSRGGSDQGDMQDFFNRFFGGGGNDDGSDQGGGEREALGSGFIVDSRGYIITNNHVVDKADKICVEAIHRSRKLHRPRPSRARRRHQPETDIAVIKIDALRATFTVKLGNSDGAQVGDWVRLAIGGPFSLVRLSPQASSPPKNRSIQDAGGKDGGPSGQFQQLHPDRRRHQPRQRGRPAGRYGRTGHRHEHRDLHPVHGLAGCRVRHALQHHRQRLQHAHQPRAQGHPRLHRHPLPERPSPPPSAANTVSPTAVILRSMKVKSPANGPAAKAGLKPGDVIVTIDGKPVKDGDALVADISARKVGSTVQLGLLRDGAHQTRHRPASPIVRQTLRRQRQRQSDDRTPPPAQSDAGESKLGITVTAIAAAIAAKLGDQGRRHRSTASAPAPSPTSSTSTQGAVIVEINRHPITDEASYRAIVSALKSGDDVRLRQVRSTWSRRRLHQQLHRRRHPPLVTSTIRGAEVPIDGATQPKHLASAAAPIADSAPPGRRLPPRARGRAISCRRSGEDREAEAQSLRRRSNVRRPLRRMMAKKRNGPGFPRASPLT